MHPAPTPDDPADDPSDAPPGDPRGPGARPEAGAEASADASADEGADPDAGDDERAYRELPVTREDDRRWGAEVHHSWGDLDEKHWTKVRGDRNDEALEYYRERSKAPGVADGGDSRNSYCMSCDGVIPLSYFQFEPADPVKRHCPHCGVELDQRVRRMFNWVEIDQPHDSDLRSLLPLALAVVALAVLVAVALFLVG